MVKTIGHVHVILFLMWSATFYLHEKYIPDHVAKRCSFSHYHNQTLSDSTQPNSSVDTTPINVMLIADSQLIDNHTYPGRNGFLMKISQHTVDIYLKKNYKALVNQLNPDYIFFLGDYLDNGRSSTDEYFKDQYKRFNSIFHHKHYIKGKNIFTNVVGNHDIGVSDGVKVYSRTRFAETFGDPNSIVKINGVSIISLDTPSLLSKNETIRGSTQKFIDNLANSDDNDKRILLSHIPLYRDPLTQTCGPLRESSKFSLLKGYQYQLFVDYDTSQMILNTIKPELIFSGDDHDYCDIMHSSNNREITVKSISMAMGISHPGIQLLTFVRIDDFFSYNTKLCYLPTPYRNIMNYVMMAIFSGSVIIVCVLVKVGLKRYSPLPLHFNESGRDIDAFKDLNSSQISTIMKYWYTFNMYCEKYKSLDILKHFILLGFSILAIYGLFIMSI